MEIGQKCVCIDDAFHSVFHRLYKQFPKKDVVYVIRDIRIGIRLVPKQEGDISLLLVGLVNPKANSKAALELGFSSSRFRTLEELKEESKTQLPAEKENKEHQIA